MSWLDQPRGKTLAETITKTISVLIIDDHPLFRDALEVALMKSKTAPQNIKSASNICDAISSIKDEDLSLILLDLNLSDSQGFEGLSKIRLVNKTTPIIIISATESPQAYRTAMSLGAAGYIPKSSPLGTISNSIDRVLSGGQAFPDNMSNIESEDDIAAKKIGSLTPAQQRVMGCLSDGLLNKQIAFEMGISEATVKAHMTAIFRKLGANNRTQALLVFRDAVRV